MPQLVLGFVVLIICVVAIYFVAFALALALALGVFALTRAGRPVIRQHRLVTVAGMSLGWAVVGTAAFVLVTFVASGRGTDFLPIKQADFWIDALNFAAILGPSVFIANRFALAPRGRRALAAIQPALVLGITIGATLVCDIAFRGAPIASISEVFAIKPRQFIDLSQFETINYIEAYRWLVTATIEFLRDAPMAAVQQFERTGGSAFALLPLMSTLLLVWSVLAFVFSAFGLKQSALKPAEETFRACLKTSGKALAGWVLAATVLAFFMSRSSATMQSIWDVLLSLLGLVLFIPAAVAVLFLPMVVIGSFAIASISPSEDFVQATNDRSADL